MDSDDSELLGRDDILRIVSEDVEVEPVLGEASLADESDYLEERRAIELRGMKQDIAARKRYAAKLFSLIVWWLVAIFFILLLAGFHNREFLLSDNVLMALIGGTTVNVLGLFLVVVKYLFPDRK